jgi:hypothetical protein
MYKSPDESNILNPHEWSDVLLEFHTAITESSVEELLAVSDPVTPLTDLA